MLNQVVLVGRLVRDPQLNETEKGKKMMYVTLAIPRSFKNMKGEYDTDFIDCVLWDGLAQNTSEYCEKGNIVGVKGRIQSRVIEHDTERKYITEVVAEKISFLSSNKKEPTTESSNEET
ncbi:MAG: single-stranded DNA-binding protein [Bacilli bacterium]